MDEIKNNNGKIGNEWLSTRHVTWQRASTESFQTRLYAFLTKKGSVKVHWFSTCPPFPGGLGHCLWPSSHATRGATPQAFLHISPVLSLARGCHHRRRWISVA